MIRGGFGIFFDRQNLTFFFVPNTQKIVAGYECGNHPSSAVAAGCNGGYIPGVVIQPQQYPNIMSNLGQASQGYQLLRIPRESERGRLRGQRYSDGILQCGLPCWNFNGGYLLYYRRLRRW